MQFPVEISHSFDVSTRKCNDLEPKKNNIVRNKKEWDFTFLTKPQIDEEGLD